MTAAVPTLTTERLVLRGWQLSDFAPLAAFYADDPASAYVGGPRRGRDTEMWFLARAGQWALRGYGSFVIAERGGADFVGWCGVNHYFDTAEPIVQYALVSDHRGKGYMAEAGRTTLDFLFSAVGTQTLYTTIHPNNAASQNTARQLRGMPTGKTEVDDGETVDRWAFHPVGVAT